MGNEQPICVAVLMGGQSHEHSISLKTGAAVSAALDPNRFRVLPVVIQLDGTWDVGGESNETPPTSIPATGGIAALADQGVDTVFIALHGPYGEDGRIQGALDIAGIPYTGSGVAASALAMNKSFTKSILREANIPVPSEVVIAREDWERDKNPDANRTLAQTVENTLGLPLFVKPVHAGSSVGASPVDERDELIPAIESALEVDVLAMVEPRLQGREMTVAVLEDREHGKVHALPVVEIEPVGHRFFDFESKYTPGHNREICPAVLEPSLAEELSSLAVKAHKVLGCRGVSRSDFIITKEGPYLLELNSLPGLTQESLVPKACHAAGITFPDLVAQLIDVALQNREEA